VVIKVLPDEIATALSRERFRREILTSATLQHPNIVSVISAGDKGGLIHFVMPYVDGESLRGRLQREGTLTPVSVVSIMRDVARALAYAHERGVVHRDIKPDNVLLSHGAAVVADFGVAKAFASAREGATGASATLTNVGMSLGTPAYMAPEQVAGDTRLDARTDLYALGALAYEALSGRPVFPRESVAAVLRAHLTDTPEPLRHIKPGIPLRSRKRCSNASKRIRRRDRNRRRICWRCSRIPRSSVVRSHSRAGAFDRRPGDPARHAWRIGIATVVGMAALVTALTMWRGRDARDGTVATRPALPTIAVLPLLSVAADSSSNYLAFGVTDEIINALSRIGGVRVTSRSAAQEAQRNSLSLAQLAERLGVTHA
jgi:serine/threonine-protein kinase